MQPELKIFLTFKTAFHAPVAPDQHFDCAVLFALNYIES